MVMYCTALKRDEERTFALHESIVNKYHKYYAETSFENIPYTILDTDNLSTEDVIKYLETRMI